MLWSVPHQLWCFGLEHQTRLMHFIPRGQHDRSGYEMVTGKTPDVSEYLDFDFYNLVWYWWSLHPSLFKHNRELAQWMGIAHSVGSYMCYWLMPIYGNPVVNTTVQHITAKDLRNPDIKLQVDKFTSKLRDCLNNNIFILLSND